MKIGQNSVKSPRDLRRLVVIDSSERPLANANVRAKLVCERIGMPSESTRKNQKPEWEIQLETQIKKIYENRPKW